MSTAFHGFGHRPSSPWTPSITPAAPQARGAHPGPHAHALRWTHADILDLRAAVAAGVTARAFAKAQGRSWSSVKAKAWRLELCFARERADGFVPHLERVPLAGHAVLDLVEAQLRGDPRLMAARPRGRVKDAWARYIALYVAHVGLGWSKLQSATLIGRTEKLAYHALPLLEDARDQGEFDEALEALCERASEVVA